VASAIQVHALSLNSDISCEAVCCWVISGIHLCYAVSVWKLFCSIFDFSFFMIIMRSIVHLMGTSFKEVLFKFLITIMKNYYN